MLMMDMARGWSGAGEAFGGRRWCDNVDEAGSWDEATVLSDNLSEHGLRAMGFSGRTIDAVSPLRLKNGILEVD